MANEVKICDLETQSLGELKPLIAKCAYIPFKEYGLEEHLGVNYVIEKLSDVLSQGGFILVAKEQGETVGLISLKRLEWDSRHFGTEISKVTHLLALGDYFKSVNIKKELISNLLARCYSNLLLHINARIDKEDLSSAHALELNSFRLMDVLVTYSFDFRKQTRVDMKTQYRIRRYRQNEIYELAEIARACFRDNPVVTDRFHADPTLPKEKSGEVYVKWLMDSFQNQCSQVLVAELDGTPVGFNLCAINKLVASKLPLRLGTIDLTAVKPSERGKLIATSLLNASLDWFTNKVDIVESGGQVSNYAIQRAWSKVGFKPVRSQCTFHWSVLPDSR